MGVRIGVLEEGVEGEEFILGDTVRIGDANGLFFLVSLMGVRGKVEEVWFW